MTSLSHRHRHKWVVATLLLSADLNETGENAGGDELGFPLSKAQNDSSLEL